MSGSFTYTISDIYVAVSYNKVLSGLKDIWAHVGSVADWGRGKKPELGCNNPHVDHEAFCWSIEVLMGHTAQLNILSPVLWVRGTRSREV